MSARTLRALKDFFPCQPKAPEGRNRLAPVLDVAERSDTINCLNES